ncbi:PKD domain-containing protein [Aequorivita sp. Q41]|uniref:DUF7849 domain-containing protein n=1 Tax=Aequorivita sp. Q41 TaxID=3153300 RepID=UPI003241FA41
MKKANQAYYYFLLILMVSAGSFSQNPVQDTLTRTAPIFYDVMGNKVAFRPEMPPLNQIAGAPKAFYTYYWEFGDGSFGFKEKPKHAYKNKGEYTARLWSTNNYDNGKPPKSRPEIIKIETDYLDQASASNDFIEDSSPTVFLQDEDLIIKTNRDPLPEQEMVLITSYKNTKNYSTSGSLYLYYNDKKFKDDNFSIEDTRMHNGETIVSASQGFASHLEKDNTTSFLATTAEAILINTRSIQDSTKRLILPVTLEESEKLYRNVQHIEFENMQPGEERHIFRTLKTTPEMLKDTSAIVTLRTIYVPDNKYGNHTVKDTELEIVTSHDPNKMSNNGTLLNYRLVRYKKVKFKVKFQNNGEGPANTIRLEVDTPDMFDKNTLEVTEMYPECPICPKEREVNYSCLDTIIAKDKIIFTFKKIYLPGTAQKNVVERDSTKGFVKYAMKFGKDFHKQKTRSRTAIYFDKNEPIITNYSTTRFMPGISIGAKAGYIFTPSKNNSREYFAGVTVSPFKSYRGYLQAEFYLSAASFDDLKNFETSSINDLGIESLMRFSEQNKENSIKAYLVPISYRYNINNFLAVGAGVQLNLDLTSTTETTTNGTGFINVPGEGTFRDERNDTFQESECSSSFSNFNSGIFIGVNAGAVRIGPSVGVRYVLNFNEPNSQIQAYAIWKL